MEIHDGSSKWNEVIQYPGRDLGNLKIMKSKERRIPRILKGLKMQNTRSLKNSMSQNLENRGIMALFLFLSIRFNAPQTSQSSLGVLSVCAATPIFFRVAATVKSSEKSGEGRRRAIYDEGTNVESGEKREILNGRERIPNATGEGKGRSNRSEKFGWRERVGRRVIKEGTASLRPFSFRLCFPDLHRRRFR